MKKFIALFVSSIFAFSLGIAYAQEEKALNPWERDMQTSAKKEDKAKKDQKAKKQAKKTKTNKKSARKANVEKDQKTNTEKVETASVEKAEKKEPAQKKWYVFW